MSAMQHFTKAAFVRPVHAIASPKLSVMADILGQWGVVDHSPFRVVENDACLAGSSISDCSQTRCSLNISTIRVLPRKVVVGSKRAPHRELGGVKIRISGLRIL